MRARNKLLSFILACLNSIQINFYICSSKEDIQLKESGVRLRRSRLTITDHLAIPVAVIDPWPMIRVAATLRGKDDDCSSSRYFLAREDRGLSVFFPVDSLPRFPFRLLDYDILIGRTDKHKATKFLDTVRFISGFIRTGDNRRRVV